MNSLIVLCLAGAAVAAPQLPAGLTIQECVNYPYCDQVTGFLAVPDVPGAADVIRAQELLIRGGAAGPAALPGLAAHQAAEAALKEDSREGFAELKAAEAAVLYAQGRVPEGLTEGQLAHYLAEQAVLASQG